ncbi:MAG TPA: EamA family transporter [Steroidobacteraceae bacterium]|jgi:transporter family protein
MDNWKVLALGSAVFAALTAILAKVGVANVSSEFATFFRTAIVLAVSALFVTASGAWQPVSELPVKSLVFLTLSGVATGLSWLCYFKALQLGPASAVAPIDKLSVVLVVLFAALFLGESLSWKVAAGATLVSAGVAILAL